MSLFAQHHLRGSEIVSIDTTIRLASERVSGGGSGPDERDEVEWARLGGSESDSVSVCEQRRTRATR